MQGSIPEDLTSSLFFKDTVYNENKINVFIITLLLKDYVCFLFLDPQDEVGPSCSSSVVLFSLVFLDNIIAYVLAVCLCPSSVCVVATFSGTVLFPLICSVLQFFA